MFEVYDGFFLLFPLIHTAETVNHQVLCKQKLVLELEKDRKRLERMQRELQAIQAPIPDGGIDQLNLDIDQLRNDCKLMASLVEEAGPSYGMAIDKFFIFTFFGMLFTFIYYLQFF